MGPLPTKVKLAGPNNTLTIQWSDGHASAYPYHFLRDRCPCATCEGSGRTSQKPASPFPMLSQKPLRPDRAELVGRYGLQIFWNDGHSAGIYAFDYLRSLCPCAECDAQRLTQAE